MKDPRALKKWLILAAVLYLLLPRDLIPDLFGRGLGLVDDAAVIALLTWFYRRRLPELMARSRARAEAGAGRGGEREGPGGPAGRPDATADPYQVLGVPRSASPEAIRAAYRARMGEYHPDKVAHLGEELQQLAHRKAQDIQRAYEALSS